MAETIDVRLRKAYRYDGIVYGPSSEGTTTTIPLAMAQDLHAQGIITLNTKGVGKKTIEKIEDAE